MRVRFLNSKLCLRAGLVGVMILLSALTTSAALADHEPRNRCANSKPHPPGCLIKGNISRNGQIYHVPGKSRWYEKTCINRPGERWFCSEQEARRAGWRAPLR